MISMRSVLPITMALVVLAQGCSSKQEQEEVPAEGTAESAEPSEESANAEETDSTDATAEQDVAAAPSEASAATGDTPVTSPQSEPVANYSGNGSATVQYVKVGEAALLDAPGGKAIGKLFKGDHVLVTAEGEWARTSDGQFIAVKHLSSKAVPRVKKPAKWGAGAAH